MQQILMTIKNSGLKKLWKLPALLYNVGHEKLTLKEIFKVQLFSLRAKGIKSQNEILSRNVIEKRDYFLKT